MAVHQLVVVDSYKRGEVDLVSVLRAQQKSVHGVRITNQQQASRSWAYGLVPQNLVGVTVVEGGDEISVGHGVERRGVVPAVKSEARQLHRAVMGIRR